MDESAFTASFCDFVRACLPTFEAAAVLVCLARALAHVINLLDPDVIVVGGGLSSLDRIYSSVPRLWTGFAYAAEPRTRLVPAAHGGASGVRGAAMLWD